VPVDLSPIIAATTLWLIRAYPAPGGSYAQTLVERQAREAVTVATWLRYPTSIDAALVLMLGPGGSDRLDWLVDLDYGARTGGGDGDYDDGTGTGDEPGEDWAAEAWRTWVDEAVVSWAACLLGEPELAVRAVAAVAGSAHLAGLNCCFRRLTEPDERDLRAGALLRHPDLLAPVADLHREQLLDRLGESRPAR
jgi:hypothetical protein